ncbi:DUF4269 domain-containing protein [Aeromonas rivipollensis]|uniref:DUF4269 domain-containing protein n=1 Tax=Aeromonas rivipollensis TaxID=948519 RepID=UPI00259E74F2|nr:DUF4269 domain-containing protein [Aeromonas rivipollensis]MDM5057639.1 DUF4269 domain-containing protein [Aeromonas rivipollensis]
MLSDCRLLGTDITAAPAAVFPSAQATPANWRRLDYLAQGNPRQRSAHALLNAGCWDALGRLCQDLALVSTVAIGLDRPGSDLDILCQHPDPARFAALLREQGWTASDKGHQVWLMEQTLTGPDQARWPVELYVTQAPLETLNGWRHLSLMAALLEHFGHDFYQAVLHLRLESGLKGEAAICRLLGLGGDPYAALLTLEGRALAKLHWQAHPQCDSSTPADSPAPLCPEPIKSTHPTS